MGRRLPLIEAPSDDLDDGAALWKHQASYPKKRRYPIPPTPNTRPLFGVCLAGFLSGSPKVAQKGSSCLQTNTNLRYEVTSSNPPLSKRGNNLFEPPLGGETHTHTHTHFGFEAYPAV